MALRAVLILFGDWRSVWVRFFFFSRKLFSFPGWEKTELLLPVVSFFKEMIPQRKCSPPPRGIFILFALVGLIQFWLNFGNSRNRIRL